MPLYLPAQAQSCLLPAIETIAVKLSRCQAVQDLAEAGSEAAALQSIVIGPNENEPRVGETFTEKDLSQRHFRLLLQSSPNNGYSSGRGKQRHRRLHSGVVIADFKRYIRDGEDLNDVYRFFTDRVAAVVEPQLFEACEVDGQPWLQRVDWIDGPWEDDPPRTSAQGKFYWAKLNITWGRGGGN